MVLKNKEIMLNMCINISYLRSSGDFMKKVPTATCAFRDKYIISIECVYTPSTFYMKSAVAKK